MRGTQTDGSAAIWAEGGFLATGSETWPPTPLRSRRQVARHPEIPNAATATGKTSVVALRPECRCWTLSSDGDRDLDAEQNQRPEQHCENGGQDGADGPNMFEEVMCAGDD